MKRISVIIPVYNVISLHKPVSNIFDKYIESSILVLTSRCETFGLVLPEAMSCGLPVVSFSGYGPSEIITDGKDGFLIPNYDTDKFAEKLSLLMDDEDLRSEMGNAAIESSQKYDAEHIIPQWMKLFESLKK